MPGVLMAEHKHDYSQPAPSLEGKFLSKGDAPIPRSQIALNGIVSGTAPADFSGPEIGLDHALKGIPSSPSAPAVIPNSLAKVIHNLPPEIEHITIGYQPLAKLYDRVSQECFNSLNDLINALGDAPNLVPQLNGNSITNGNDQTSSASAAKRLKWIHFADEYRQKFIKLLVLNKWSKSSPEVGRLIDLHVWSIGQFGLYEEAALSLGELKRNLDGARLMRPDIETALEVLTSGKSSRMPELNYIVPECLSPQKLLKTLRNINTLLAIRLNLHEDLPRHFSTFSISSGRATFIVPSEFEVDLSIASDDPSQQLYFVDFRFAFTTHSEIPAGQLRNNLERMANLTLSTEGLTGLFSLLHDFVLTHKLNLLRRKALELSRDAWSGSLKVEQVRRSLVIQYWMDRPGHKSWVEIAVSSGKLDVPEWRKDSQQSRLAARWMRNGKEVKITGVSLDPESLSLEELLNSIVAQHISYILSSIQGDYQQPIPMTNSISTSLKISGSDPTEVELRLPLTSSRSSTVLIEPVTGQFALQPPTSDSARCESYLNSLREPATEACSKIRYWQAIELRSIATAYAERSGWESLKNLHLSADVVKAHFGPGVILVTAFKRKGWGFKWAVFSTISSGGQSWWAVELSSATPATNIVSSMLLPTQDEFGLRKEVKRGFFGFLEDLAVSLISFTVLGRELKLLGVSYTYQHPSYSKFRLSRPTMVVQLSSLLQSSVNAPQQTLQPWAVDLLQLSIHKSIDNFGSKLTPSKIEYVVKGSMNQSPVLYTLLRQAGSTEVSLSKNGSFAMAIRADLGVSVLENIVVQLESLAQLRSFLATLDNRKFKCVEASLHGLKFDCGTIHKGGKDTITADVHFKPSGRIEPNFTSASSRTPFNRIHTSLVRELAIHRQSSSKAFDFMARAITFLLPLLRAFDSIEDHITAEHRLLIHSRALDQWYLTYRQPARIFRISLKNRRGRSLWHIEDLTARKPVQPATAQPNGAPPPAAVAPEPPTPLQAALNTLYSTPQTADQDWHGLHRSLVAGLEGVEDALAALDHLVRSHAADIEEKLPPPAAAHSATTIDPPRTQLPAAPLNLNGGPSVPASMAAPLLALPGAASLQPQPQPQPQRPGAGGVPAVGQSVHARNVSAGKMAGPAAANAQARGGAPGARPNGGLPAPAAAAAQKRKLHGVEVVNLDD